MAGSEKSAAYSEAMKARMGSTLTYKHEDGMNWSKPLGRIIVGSCLQTAADVDTLKKEGVGIVFCLQEDKDLAHFDIDIASIQQRAIEVGIDHVRNPIKDFDPLSLRRHLPNAVKRLESAMAKQPEALAYIHCTAGLGRAPGTALAHMFWLQGRCLDEAYAELYELRRCHPQMGMIRAATCDLLGGGMAKSVPTCLAIACKDAKVVEIAGLDVGWSERLPLVKDTQSGEFVLKRDLPPGTYQYKFIVDGKWTTNMDLPTVEDNGNLNNVAEVSPGGMGTLVPTCLTMARKEAQVVEIAGLDVGWSKRLRLEKDQQSGEFVLRRSLPPGTYHYKFIVDGQWMPNMDLPTVEDNGNVNNVAEVVPEPGSPDAERRARIMAKGGRPTEEELGQLREMLGS